ncbi:hypothetical protein PaeBR_19210 [Paenibacillus sp. BR2-3]
MGGTTGVITRPFAGRVFFVCVDISVPQNLTAKTVLNKQSQT